MGADQPAAAGGGDRPVRGREAQRVLVGQDVLEDPGEPARGDPVGVAPDPAPAPAEPLLEVRALRTASALSWWAVFAVRSRWAMSRRA